MGGWHLRVVTDRTRAFDWLVRAWPHLERPFFDWLRTGEQGTTYRLVRAVVQPELWVHPTPADTRIAAPVEEPVLVGVLR